MRLALEACGRCVRMLGNVILYGCELGIGMGKDGSLFASTALCSYNHMACPTVHDYMFTRNHSKQPGIVQILG